MLVYKMNQLLLLAGLVLVLYIMNEKKMFKDVTKTLSSDKNNTMLVLVFCGVILFMCMQKDKVMEYFTLQSLFESNMCPPPLKSHSVAVVNDEGTPVINPVQVCVNEYVERILKSNEEEMRAVSGQEEQVQAQEQEQEKKQPQPQEEQEQEKDMP